MKALLQSFKEVSLITVLLLIAMIFSLKVDGQTATINLDFTGATNIFGTCGGSDNTYANGTGSVNFNGGVPAGYSITGISVSTNLGEAFNGTTTFTFTLNGITIGTINNVTTGCQVGSFNANTIPSYNNTGTNTFAFSGSGTGTRGVYNAMLTITYTCTPPAAPNVTTPVTYCQNVPAVPLTATGSNLSWYTASTGGIGSQTAPTPVTTTAGTTSYYVSQSVGCEGARAQIDVVVNALPVSSVPSQTNITCYSASDGTITVSASGGTSPYTFSVDGTNFYSETSSDTRLFTGLAPNTPYTIKVKDNNGCVSK